MKILNLSALFLSAMLFIGGANAQGARDIQEIVGTRRMYNSCVEWVNYLDKMSGANKDIGVLCATSMNWLMFGLISADQIYIDRGISKYNYAFNEVFGCHEKSGFHPDSNDFIRIFVIGVRRNPKLMSVPVVDSLKEIMSAEFPCKE